MSIDSGNIGGLFGTAIGFVILGEGIRLIRDSEREYYQKRGHKIQPLINLSKHYKKTGKIIDNIKIPRYI